MLDLIKTNQITYSSNEDVKANAATCIENLKAQIKQLMGMKAFIPSKVLAASLAQMARELAAAVSEYVQTLKADLRTANDYLGKMDQMLLSLFKKDTSTTFITI